MITSHGDNDHIGGAEAVHSSFAVGYGISSVPDKIHWRSVTPCQVGQHWQWDGVDFEILHPADSPILQGNNDSGVLHVSNGDQSILLTVDIEALAEQRLSSKYSTQL